MSRPAVCVIGSDLAGELARRVAPEAGDNVAGAAMRSLHAVAPKGLPLFSSGIPGIDVAFS